MEFVVDFSKACPLKTTIGQFRKEPARHGFFSDFAYRMNANIPPPRFAFESMGESAGNVMLLQNQHSLSHFGKHRRRRHPAHAGPNQNIVPRTLTVVR